MQPRGRLHSLMDKTLDASQEIATQGYTIVDVVSPKEAEWLAARTWDDLESLGTGIDRNDPSTWTNDKWPQTTHGLLQNQQMGLMEGTCLARLATKPAWEKLFAGKPIIASFDAISVCRPKSQERAYQFEVRNQRKKFERVMLSSWCHTDQAKAKTQCAEQYQGAFALNAIGEAEQRTQLVIPPEGMTIQEFRDAFIAAFPPETGGKKKSIDPEREEWIKHTDAERAWLIDNGRIVAPTLKAGQMLIWDSGVPHASIPGPAPPDGSERNVRISVFVSALPIQLIEEEDIKLRRKMLEQGDTSGHRVTSKGKKGYRQCKFSKKGRTYPGEEIPNFATTRVVSGFKRAIEDNEDTTAAKIARMCGGY